MHTRNLFLLFFFTIFLPFSKPDLAADRAALLKLRSSVGGRTLFWNITQQSPCSWAGVACEGNRVTVLRLPGVALSGQLPEGIFANLTQLRTLSLRLNALNGHLPSDLGSCTNLRNLYLQGNMFSGEIPEFLFGLHDLVRLNLGENNFTGEISPSFGNFTRLRTLFLENNRLSGSVPDLKLDKLEQFNVSNNLLNGSIPERLHLFDPSSFLGNSLCGQPLASCSGNSNVVVPSTPTDEAGNGGKKKNLSAGAIAGIVIGSIVGLFLIVLILMFLCRKKGSKKSRSIDIASIKQQELAMPGEKPIGEVENGSGGGYGNGNGNGYSVAAAAAAAMVGHGKGGAAGGEVNGGKKLVFFGKAARVFDLEDLLRASAEVLGKGTFGTAYKAVLEMGTVVAVKRLKDVTITEREFKEKIETVGALDHESLVPLRAYYFSRDEKLLVYDYMPMGSLSALLHGNKGGGRTPLNWEIRSGIALGAARGIQYIHSQGPNVSHGNIKSSNILLTQSYEARVSDFGLAHLVGPSSTPNRVAGYRAPEVTDPRKVSQKADVYSFGVLLLELLTGKPPTHALLNEEGVDLPRWVQSIVREEWTSEVFDLELLRYQNVEEEMVQLLQLGIDCAAQYPDNRPSMSEVTNRIEELRRSSIREDQDPEPDVVDLDDSSSR
ncbi:probable inactive receptor kinase At1g48480 [Ricinus communis]|uniref:ATP binding protein, putative n=1 Tax=Ricinus communis TaxID=3988 RepID=B9T5A8_RICCO|nr:probable inactive receptor kinase At1g48480 [Ricinus communis]EEF28958.1 ATP binding protein, putative [Ricinus communis]|eukprot:XP_002533427.1 probable inactive receptor kinase At1g48480 [Ricinus communis]